MPIYLKERDALSKELMDDPNCDQVLLFNTYKQFITVNKLLSRWHKLYKKYMLPYMKKNPGRRYTLLDVGCGAGDVLCQFARFAKKDGIHLELHGIDPDPNAELYRKTQTFPENIKFSTGFLNAEFAARNKYDFVINNNMLHHLTGDELQDMFINTKELCNVLAIFNDVERSDLSYFFFPIFALFFRNSYVPTDGWLSIKRCYTRAEISALLPNDWQAKSLILTRRLLLLYKKN